jgi:mRNA interferase MazF
MVERAPSQGDIIKINLNPRKGREQQGYRPVIVLSADIVARYSNVVIVAPISTTERKLPLYCGLPKSLTTKGVVLLDQIVTIDYTARSFNFIERVPDDFLEGILDIVRRIFAVSGTNPSFNKKA